jgi:methyltransferase
MTWPHDLIGAPQVAALLVLGQRGLEELHSARNTRRLIAEGATEAGREFYPVVVVTHLAWIAGVFFLLPADAPFLLLPFAVYMALQVARYWVIGTLGRYWTHRIITRAEAPIVRRGPYLHVRHPNYVITIAETLLLPVVFGGWALGIIMAAVWSAVIRYKIQLEDRALGERRAASEPHRSTATK